MSDSGTSLSAPLQSFFDAANALANAPTSSAARQSVLGAAQSLGARVGTMQAQLDGMASGINQSLSSTVAVINGDAQALARLNDQIVNRSEEHTSELQSLMRISYAVFCLTKKTHKRSNHTRTKHTP